MEKRKIRVAVGMSGGVDSAMTASLLLEQGYDVFGITMQIWNNSYNLGEKIRSGCFGPGEAEDIKDAKSIADRLGIEHHVISLAEEYEKEVLNYYRNEYVSGRTPNPCVVCNLKMKFGLLLDRAEKSGLKFDYFATGHYARILKNQNTGKFHLLKAIDQAKDQSYFLYSLTQDVLARTLFPLGERLKKDIIALAHKKGFEDIASKEESQDFIECKDHSPLFKENDSKPGPIVDTAGKLLGYHRGLIHYTIGQREGLGVAVGEKVYVKEIRTQTNTLVVAPKEEVFRVSCIVGNLRWIAGDTPSSANFACKARTRYRQKEFPAKVSILPEGYAEVLFDEPQFAITPGQSAVFYDGDEILGGGVIER
ncbi:MAG: tRNA 2-thiouridine(34) synthase MnmA [Candidatus Nanoarchaeia archaeon]